MSTQHRIPTSFSSQRVNATRLESKHEDPLFHIHADERVATTLGGAKSSDQNRAWLDEKLQHWDDRGYGLFAFYDGAETFIGRGGLLYIEIEGRSDVELNYSIASNYWGRGYATEVALRLLEVGFEHLSVERVIAFTLASNVASQRVMQKVGMTYSHDFDHHGQPHVLYQIERP